MCLNVYVHRVGVSDSQAKSCFSICRRTFTLCRSVWHLLIYFSTYIPVCRRACLYFKHYKLYDGEHQFFACNCVLWMMENPSWSHEASPAIWDHTVLPWILHRWTCPHSSQTSQCSIYLPWRDRKLTLVLVIYWSNLPVCRQSAIEVLTGPSVGQLLLGRHSVLINKLSHHSLATTNFDPSSSWA